MRAGEIKEIVARVYSCCFPRLHLFPYKREGKELLYNRLLQQPLAVGLKDAIGSLLFTDWD